MNISKRAENTAASETLAISAKCKELKKQGLDVVNLSVGEPDFDTPQHIKEAAILAINRGFTKYTDASGILELKEAIAKKLWEDNGLKYEPQQIVVSGGAKHSIYNSLLALCNDGDEVLIPTPYWVSYGEMVKLAGGTPVVLQTDEDTLKLTPQALEEATLQRTKGIILNSPQNPAGIVYSENELLGLATVIKEKGLWVISDEVYERFVYDGNKHISIATFIPDQTIVINGPSKTYSMTGWRIGYTAGDIKVIKAISRIQSQTTSNPCSISQYAALSAITGPQECVEEMRLEFDTRRKFMVDRLNNISGITCKMPGGAFYLFCNIKALSLSSEEFSDRLLEKAQVAVVPGKAFGAEGFIRLSYAVSLSDLEKAGDRIEEAVKLL
ncbi:pyridoxal phosphate-dependent aminotransferase [bacterium]|nr:pyridoxal phosphate-dependent aminotransferase [bacterium]